MNISPKSELLLFDSFRINGMKHFVVSDDKKIVGKVLKDLEFADQKENKLTLVKLKFSMNSYENLAENEIKKTIGNCTRLISSDTQFWKK